MALVATSVIASDKIESLITEVIKYSAQQPGLTPRSSAALGKIANNGDLILLFEESTLIGWGIREPLAPRVKEVGMMFIKPQHRSVAAFVELCRELAATNESLVIATYNKAFLDLLISRHGFRQASLTEVARKSWGRFIFKRLTKTARSAVQKHLQSAKPLFGIRGKK